MRLSLFSQHGLFTQMRLHSAIVDLTLTPFTKFLQKVLDDIKEVDNSSVFACPVDISEVR